MCGTQTCPKMPAPPPTSIAELMACSGMNVARRETYRRHLTRAASGGNLQDGARGRRGGQT